ncbi:uncharacterized protein LOC121942441 [Plectropomus leopardus]|uniref:uncharacterized protein LOC121942441 n=1 Tax=Plectropomus leopardus TaxID=160734 RepID=UPI001C4B0258|nr:uncharacterized protein LOC121942441 [Plectropomus leopardus]
MGQQDKEMDIESLQKSGRRRRNCLDVFLVVSVIILFVAVTAVAAGGVMVVMELRSKLEPPRPPFEFQTSELTGDNPNPTYKMENFAYLEATSCQLKTSTMEWAPVHYGAGNSVGSNFVFDQEQHSLMPVREGTYFIYVELNLTCTSTCNAGVLSIRVADDMADKLTCEVDLPAHTRHVSRKCWTVSQLDGQKLIAQLSVPNEGLQNWKLEMSGSGLGMFHVD